MKHIKNIHPGEVLKEEFLVPLNISDFKVSIDIAIPLMRNNNALKDSILIKLDW